MQGAPHLVSMPVAGSLHDGGVGEGIMIVPADPVTPMPLLAVLTVFDFCPKDDNALVRVILVFPTSF